MKLKLMILTAIASLAVAATATAATLGEWLNFENNGVMCSIGRKGSSVDAAGVCVLYGGTYDGWSFSFDNELGVKVKDGRKRIVVARGALGRG